MICPVTFLHVMLVYNREKIYLRFFSLYINDLDNFLQEKRIVGLQSVSESIEKELMIFLKIMVLLYADKTVILAESAEDLQLALNEFFIYCTQWKLNVNVEKTKIMIFSKGPMMKKCFYYNGDIIENVKEFNLVSTASCLPILRHSAS